MKKITNMRFDQNLLATNLLRLLLLLFFIGLFNVIFGQVIHSTSNQYDADYKVYLTDNKYEADWVIYVTDSKYDAKEGRWFMTSNKFEADHTIYLTDNRYIADKKVYITNNPYDTKFNN